MLKHIVFINFNEPTEQLLIETQQRLLSLQGKIEQLLSIEVGIDVLRSERSFDLALITVFDSLDAMKAYQVHPAHEEFLNYLAPIRKSSCCVDYEF